MSAQFARAPHQSRPVEPTYNAPHAALLIDFDNVTMGIRSDLTRELKNLLNSDVIKGKVAVQRAYADWRRYPQYIVPLSEASVDLIFAPAYGSSKKNATDIRLAIDALELVFTRPEIGTFILLSGDSDFSSMVLKLKEYGKYIIGVGIRESSSDLLVQNCDEYYSYSALTGLTRTSDEPMGEEDPWILVERAVRQMAEHDDVMRSDRLKQVMLELDSNFDEKAIGFSKFNRFVTEAAGRGCLKIRKLENGQYEVAPGPSRGEDRKAEERPREDRSREDRSREDRPRAERDRGRGGRAERGRDRARRPPEDREPRASTPASAIPDRPAAAEPEEAATGASGVAEPAGGNGLDQAHGLLVRAVREILAEGAESAVRDSDVKRRILEIEPGWDESVYGFSKFSRFLRHAHDSEIVDLRKSPEGYYEVVPGSGAPGGAAEPPRRAAAAVPAEAEEVPAAAMADRARPGREESPARDAPAASRGREAPVEAAGTTPPAEREAAGEVAGAAAGPATGATAGVEKPRDPEVVATPDAGPTSTPARGVRALQFRRGARGARPEGPPPVLPGQVAGRDAGGGGAFRAGTGAGAKSGALESGDAGEADRSADPAAAAGAAAAGAPPLQDGHRADDLTRDDVQELGLPTDRGAIIRYISNSYKGIGEKTAEALVEAFGVEGFFPALEHRRGELEEILGQRRAELLVDAWKADYARRRGASASGHETGNGDGGRRDGAGAAGAAPVAGVGAATSRQAPEVGEGEGDRERGRRGRGGRRGGRRPEGGGGRPL